MKLRHLFPNHAVLPFSGFEVFQQFEITHRTKRGVKSLPTCGLGIFPVRSAQSKRPSSAHIPGPAFRKRIWSPGLSVNLAFQPMDPYLLVDLPIKF